MGMLNARDVRRLITGLDSESTKNKEMSISVRRHTIILNLVGIGPPTHPPTHPLIESSSSFSYPPAHRVQ